EFAILGEPFSIPRIRAAIYAADPADFRWSMTSDELARHRCLIGHKWLLQGMSVTAVETHFGDDVEGLWLINDWGGFYEWYGNGGVVFGSLIFDQQTGPLDLGWIRAVFASLEFSGAIFPETMTAEELARLFRV